MVLMRVTDKCSLLVPSLMLLGHSVRWSPLDMVHSLSRNIMTLGNFQKFPFRSLRPVAMVSAKHFLFVNNEHEFEHRCFIYSVLSIIYALS